MTAVLSSFLNYLIVMIILIAIACLGWTIGKKLRLNKDAKAAAEETSEDKSILDEGSQE